MYAIDRLRELHYQITYVNRLLREGHPEYPPRALWARAQELRKEREIVRGGLSHLAALYLILSDDPDVVELRRSA